MKKLSIACLLVTIKAAILAVAISSVQKQGVTPKLCNWDCGYYQDIALKGYGPGTQEGTVAFYPAFPMAVKYFWKFLPGEDFGWKGAVFNLLLFGLLVVLLMTWVEGLGFGHSWLVAGLLCVDRFSLWAQVPYTETMFLCIVLAFLVVSQRLKDSPLNLALAALIGGFASSVRFVGIACVGGIGLARLKTFIRNPPYGFLIAALGSWGVLSYFSYLEVNFGDWSAAIHVTEKVWGRSASFSGIFKSLWYIIKMGYFPTILLFFGSVYWVLDPPKWLRISGSERWMWASLILIPMAMTVQTSLTRYISIILLGHVFWAFTIRRMRKWPLGWVFDGMWIGIILVEIYFQEQLLEKFLRTEVFSWAG